MTHAAPAYRTEYERIFQCPVTFASHWNAMRMDPSVATWRVSQQPRYFFGVLTQRADALVRSLEDSKTTRGRIESLLMPILHTGDASADTIASAMGYSRQTLFRRLKAEGVTYTQVLDELRHRMALHYLNGDKVSVNETATSSASPIPQRFRAPSNAGPGRARARCVQRRPDGKASPRRSHPGPWSG